MRAPLETDADARALFELVHDAVLILDVRGVVEACNQRAPTAFGRREGELLGRPFAELVAPGEGDALAASARAGGGSERPLSWVRADGSAGAGLASAAPRSSDGASGLLVVVRDLTAERRLEQELEQRARVARLGQLVGGVAHDLNNPLSAVLANLDLALQDLADVAAAHGPLGVLPEVEDELRDAREAAERLRLIARDLELFSRAEDEVRGPVDVERQLDAALRLTGHELRRVARVRREYAGVEPALGNEPRLAHVFLGLLLHLAEALAPGPAAAHELTVTTRVDEDHGVWVELCVDGAPPSAAAEDRALARVGRVLAGLGGELTVARAPGAGLRLRVRLAAASAHPDRAPEGPRAPAPAPPPAVERRGRLLVVDDDPITLKAVERTLSDALEVVGLASAPAALALVAAGQRFDAILSDLMMPEMTGMELHRALADVAPDQAARMIFSTGGAFSPESRAFLDAVPNPRLEKPFDPDELLALVDQRVRWT